MIACILWFWERNKFILNLILLIDTHHLSSLSVGIIVYWATSVVGECMELFRDAQRITEFCKGQCRLITGYRALTFYASVRENGVNHLTVEVEIVFAERLTIKGYQLFLVGIAAFKAITPWGLRGDVKDNRD